MAYMICLRSLSVRRVQLLQPLMKQATADMNAIKSKLMGGYLRDRLLGNANSKHAAKELVKRSFR